MPWFCGKNGTRSVPTTLTGPTRLLQPQVEGVRPGRDRDRQPGRVGRGEPGRERRLPVRRRGHRDGVLRELHRLRGELLIGASPASAMIAETFIAAAIPTSISDTIATALWSKLIVNCAYNALSAIGQISYGPMMATEGTREVISNAIREGLAVAAACGVAMPPDIEATTLALAASMPAQTSSTAQDLARGKSSEIDFLNGHVVRMGREHNIPTPTNLALLVAVRLMEKGNAERRG